MEASIVSGLASLGAAGAVIIALFYYMQHETARDKLRTENDQKVLDRIDKIVDRHLAAEEANRKQLSDLSEQNRLLFDRVITVCTSLGGSIQELSANTKANERALLELSASTKANEKAIQDLRAEFRQLGGPQSPKALGREDPRPFPSG